MTLPTVEDLDRELDFDADYLFREFELEYAELLVGIEELFDNPVKTVLGDRELTGEELAAYDQHLVDIFGELVYVPPPMKFKSTERLMEGVDQIAEEDLIQKLMREKFEEGQTDMPELSPPDEIDEVMSRQMNVWDAIDQELSEVPTIQVEAVRLDQKEP